MIPNQRWFPTSLQDRAAWYENFNFQAQSTGVTLGLTVGDLTQIGEDNQVMQYLAGTAVLMEVFNESMTQFRNILTAGDIGDTAPPFPTIPSLPVPLIVPLAGIFERVSDVYRTRIMASATYTDEQGALYGIIGTSSAPPDPATVKPTLQTFPAAANNMFSTVVTGRGQADQVEISAAVAGTTTWQVLGSLTGKSGDVSYPNTTGKPVQLQVRAQAKSQRQLRPTVRHCYDNGKSVKLFDIKIGAYCLDYAIGHPPAPKKASADDEAFLLLSASVPAH